MPVVKLYANLRNLAGVKELSVTGVTVGAELNEAFQWSPTLEESCQIALAV